VLIAVELIDPISMSLVHHGVRVSVSGLKGSPIVSKSGRFVWLEEGDVWPAEISVDTEKLPYLPPPTVHPPQPIDRTDIKTDERRVSILLQPTQAYVFSEGITAIRGLLRESIDRKSPPLEGAIVTLAWRDDTSGRFIRAPFPATTDRAGQFTVFLRLSPVAPQRPDIVNGGMLKIQLQITHDGTTRQTPEDFTFSKETAVTTGRVREGLPLSPSLELGWSEIGGH